MRDEEIVDYPPRSSALPEDKTRVNTKARPRPRPLACVRRELLSSQHRAQGALGAPDPCTDAAAAAPDPASLPAAERHHLERAFFHQLFPVVVSRLSLASHGL